jgi:uncharacterized protein (TIGR02266 family)
MDDGALARAEGSAEGRRRSPRAHLEIEVGFFDETTFYNGFSENISAGGIFIATYKPVPIGTRISLSLTLPGERTIEITGTVRWVRDVRNPDESKVSPGIGVQFEGLAPEAQRTIEEFVEQRPPMFYDE